MAMSASPEPVVLDGGVVPESAGIDVRTERTSLLSGGSSSLAEHGDVDVVASSVDTWWCTPTTFRVIVVIVFIAAVVLIALAASGDLWGGHHTPSPTNPTVACIPTSWNEDARRAWLSWTDAEPFGVERLEPSVANGFIGTIVSSDTMYVGGVFNGRNYTTPSHRARVPSTVNYNVSGDAIVCGSALDVRRGMFLRRWRLGQSVVEQRIFAHRELRSVLVQTFTLVAGPNASLAVTLSSNSGPPSADIAFEKKSELPCILTMGSTLLSETPDSDTVSVAVCTTKHVVGAPVRLVMNQSLALLTTVRLSTESSDPMADAISDYNAALSMGADKLVESHERAWAALWESDIVVVGQARIAVTVRTSLYYILSALRDDWTYSTSPGGIATNAYNGHTFWDSETWMYPNLVLLHPSLARAMLEYRLKRVEAARLKAQSFGFAGTMFPWESAFTGRETTPLGNPEGDLEQHINGDISMAVRLLTRATSMANATEFWPIVEGVARFWASRFVYEPSDGKYHIYDVQPPDESAGRVNDSTYTNVIAGLSLAFAVKTATYMNVPLPEASNWTHMADNVYVPLWEASQIHPEYEGYDGAFINQADVALLQYPLGYTGITNQQRVNDLNYYEARTRLNGFFTGNSAYSVAWLRLGNTDKALGFFNKAFEHMSPPFSVWQEKLEGGHTHFLTGAGGYLQNIVYGYGGIQLTDASGMLLSPALPPATVSISFRKLHFGGSAFRYSFNAAQIQLEMVDGPALFVTKAAGTCVKIENTLTFAKQVITITTTCNTNKNK